MLYGLFQKFIRFDDNFRDTLWSEVDLDASTREVGLTSILLTKNVLISAYLYFLVECLFWSIICCLQVESYWDECLALPSKLKDWDAYNDMKNSIQQYRDVFPLLHNLNSKVPQTYFVEFMFLFTSVYVNTNHKYLYTGIYTQNSSLKHFIDCNQLCDKQEWELVSFVWLTEIEPAEIMILTPTYSVSSL